MLQNIFGQLRPNARPQQSSNSIEPSLTEKDVAVHQDQYVEFISADGLQFVAEKGGNDAPPTYQDVSGAPVETTSPLGYDVGSWTALFLNVSMIVGVGIFSTPSTILRGTGSVGLSLIFWVIGLILSLAGMAVYLELAAYFPSRSGAEVVYLEQAFPKPKHFAPVAFAVQTVVLAFASQNAIVLAQYLFKFGDRKFSAWEQKGLALGMLTLTCVILALSTRVSLRIVNVLGMVKLATLVFIAITGFVILGGGTSKVADPHVNFKNAFEGTSNDPYNIANALVSIIFSYGGYNNVCNVVNEVQNPIRTIKRTGNAGLIIVGVLYLLVNIAYYAALPKADILSSSQTVATMFFQKVFGARAAKGLTILPVLSAFSNMLAAVLGHSRVIREVGRQGVLPFPNFWVSTQPFGTPIGPVFAIWFVSVIMIVAPPAGDAFNFIVSLQNYPDSFFAALMTWGLFVIRRKHQRLGIPRPQFRAWTAVAILFFASKVYLLVMPWVPPKGGVNNSSFRFFYAAASLTGLGAIGVGLLYCYIWSVALPKWKGYQLRQAVEEDQDGAVAHIIVKVPDGELDEWDAKHDPTGRVVGQVF